MLELRLVREEVERRQLPWSQRSRLRGCRGRLGFLAWLPDEADREEKRRAGSERQHPRTRVQRRLVADFSAREDCVAQCRWRGDFRQSHGDKAVKLLLAREPALQTRVAPGLLERGGEARVGRVFAAGAIRAEDELRFAVIHGYRAPAAGGTN